MPPIVLMDLFEAMRERRSIRRFKPEPVPKEALEKIIQAGILAPSAGNLQSRKFFVLTGQAKKGFGAAVPTGGRFQLGHEPAVIVVCADRAAIVGRYGQRGVELYTRLDCAASIMSMLLAAHGLGLGAVWVGSCDFGAIRQALRLPGSLEPVSIIALGYPDEKPEMPPRKGMQEACEFLE